VGAAEAAEAVAVRRQFLLIHQDFNQDEGLVLILFLIPIPILILVLVLVLPLVLRHKQHHVHNNVFQPGSSWITSTTTPSNRNVLYMRDVPTISHKIDEHEVPQSHFYIAASMETSDARSESLDTP
jgi:hypothetical protein